MAIKLPLDFNYKTISLDPLETTARDELMIDIEYWAKFRHTINLGVNANALNSKKIISSDIKISYLELGKSHYEVVTMLAATKLSLNSVQNSINLQPLLFKKSFKEFYMHAGSVLDNLARLVYIINVADSVTAKGKYELKRHEIGYGSLPSIYGKKKLELKGYSKIIKNRKANSIKTIRNNFTHGWPPALFINPSTQEYLWPIAMRKKEQYYLWPHDTIEIKRINREYRKRIPLLEMISDDWMSLEQFQSTVFKKLAIDIRKFERNHNLKIQ